MDCRIRDCSFVCREVSIVSAAQPVETTGALAQSRKCHI